MATATLDPSTEFTLIVVNERGQTKTRPATVEQCYNLMALQRVIASNDMTLEDKFGLGYEHPQLGAYIMIANDEDVAEWREAGFPKLVVEISVFLKATAGISRFFGRLLGSSGPTEDDIEQSQPLQTVSPASTAEEEKDDFLE